MKILYPKIILLAYIFKGHALFLTHIELMDKTSLIFLDVIRPRPGLTKVRIKRNLGLIIEKFFIRVVTETPEAAV